MPYLPLCLSWSENLYFLFSKISVLVMEKVRSLESVLNTLACECLLPSFLYFRK